MLMGETLQPVSDLFRKEVFHEPVEIDSALTLSGSLRRV